MDDPIWPLKRQLADAILELSARETWLGAARRFGIDPSRMCDLRAGRISRFSVERLIRILATVGRGVELKVVVTTGPEEICWNLKLRARRDAYLAQTRRATETRAHRAPDSNTSPSRVPTRTACSNLRAEAPRIGYPLRGRSDIPAVPSGVDLLSRQSDGSCSSPPESRDWAVGARGAVGAVAAGGQVGPSPGRSGQIWPERPPNQSRGARVSPAFAPSPRADRYSSGDSRSRVPAQDRTDVLAVLWRDQSAAQHTPAILHASSPTIAEAVAPILEEGEQLVVTRYAGERLAVTGYTGLSPPTKSSARTND